VNTVGEPCAGKPHARFDEGRLPRPDAGAVPYSTSFFLPPFTLTAVHLWDLVRAGTLWSALGTSNTALMIGYPLAVLVGVPLGFLFGRRRLVDRAFSYWLDAALVIPMIAVVPAVIVALGLTLEARVAVVVLFALPVIGMNARAAVRVIDEGLTEMARSFGARPLRVWLQVILPAALTAVFAALRLGLARAISGMVVVELTLVPAGVGGLMVKYRSQFAAADLYAVTLAVLLEGMILIALAQALECRIARRLAGA